MMKEASARRDEPAAILDFLNHHEPFAQLPKGERQALAGRLTLKQFAAGEVIASPEDGPPKRMYLIKQGRVNVGFRAGAEEGFWDLGRGDCFPIGALVAERPVSMVLRAAEDSLCYQLKREEFDALRRRSPLFQEFCARRLANMLDIALHDVQARLAQPGGGTALSAPLRALVRRSPVTCVPETPVAEALARMQAQRVGSIVAVDAELRPQGIFTLHDLLARVSLGGVPLDRPLREVMTPEPAALEGGTSGIAAALLMADRGFGHICITESGRLIGVLSERDLFALRRLGLAHLRRDIGECGDLASLAELSDKIPELIDQLLAQGASVAQITEIITAFNDNVTRRAIELVLEETGTPSVPFSWLAFGSEGRLEQTLKTDQDNGILFQVPPGSTAEAVRAELLPLAGRINKALSLCGLPLCKGDVMARNPKWCLSNDEWADRFGEWIKVADGKMLLYASIFFDFRTLYGPEEPVEALREWLLGVVREHRNFFRRMVDNALGIEPALGLLHNFVVKKGGDAPNTLDLKLNGITPFVDGGRICALYAGVAATNTAQRLRAAGARWELDEAEVDGWIGAYELIQLLRLRRQREQLRRGEEPSNRIDPDRLNELERRTLKEAFRVARKLQRRLEQFFQF